MELGQVLIMSRAEKYYAAGVECDYEEFRVVKAKSGVEAEKKFKRGEYLGVIPGNIGHVRAVGPIQEASTFILREFNFTPRSKVGRKNSAGDH